MAQGLEKYSTEKKRVTQKIEYIFHNADMFIKKIGTTFRT